jgi:glycopeptide antibiotics resistance protein
MCTQREARYQNDPKSTRGLFGIGRLRNAPLWCWWIPVVLLLSFPWAGFTAESQWSRLHWIPFTDPADRPRDLLANIALFVPFGYSYVRHRAGRFRILEALLVATVVSVSAEATQLFSTLRYPSGTDVIAAIAGAMAGAAISRGRRGIPNP